MRSTREIMAILQLYSVLIAVPEIQIMISPEEQQAMLGWVASLEWVMGANPNVEQMVGRMEAMALRLGFIEKVKK